MCEVEWYYKRNEIIKMRPAHQQWISANEVFQTHQLDIILATTINGICQLVTMDEYEQMD